MKNVIIILTVLVFWLIFFSCEKQRLPEGQYEVFVTIQADNTTFNPCYSSLNILESNKNYLIIENNWDGYSYDWGNDTVYRNGNDFTGILQWRGGNNCIGHVGGFDNFNISGTISKEKGVYYLKGTLTTLYIMLNPYTETIDTFDAIGTFEFKSIF